MSNIIVILNILTVVGLCVSAVLAVHFEKLLSSVIALGVTGLFAAAEFLLLHAPDVAISESFTASDVPVRAIPRPTSVPPPTPEPIMCLTLFFVASR